jgi:hypothetical protein
MLYIYYGTFESSAFHTAGSLRGCKFTSGDDALSTQGQAIQFTHEILHQLPREVDLKWSGHWYSGEFTLWLGAFPGRDYKHVHCLFKRIAYIINIILPL